MFAIYIVKDISNLCHSKFLFYNNLFIKMQKGWSTMAYDLSAWTMYL